MSKMREQLGNWGTEVEDSATLALTAKAGRLRASGRDVIALTAGEPDSSPPGEAAEGLRLALETGQTHYTPAAGSDDLRGAVAEVWAKRLGVDLTWKNVVISTGAKQACFNAIAALLQRGDEVIIPVPAWVTYRAQVKMLGGVPIEIPTEMDRGFKLTAAALSEAITERTSGLILNSPSNPTGSVYGPGDLEPLLEIAEDRGLWIVSDEIYDRIVYESEAVSPVRVRPSIFSRGVVVNGVSKSYAMTGFRIGFAVADVQVASAMSRIQSQITGNPSTPGQVAALRALRGDQSFVEDLARSFSRRKRLCVDSLGQMPHISFQEPRGAFYIFIDVREVMRRRGIRDDADLCESLLEEEDIALVPGSAFGTQGFVRLSFSISDRDLERALERLHRYVSQ